MLTQLLLLLCTADHAASLASAKGAAAGPRLLKGQLYRFSYSTQVLLDRAQGSRDGSSGFRISSLVDANLVWSDPASLDHQLVQLKAEDLWLQRRPGAKAVASSASSCLGQVWSPAAQRPFLGPYH